MTNSSIGSKQNMLYKTANNQYKKITRRAVRGSNQYQVRYSRYQVRKAESQIKSLFTVLVIAGLLGYSAHVTIIRTLESRIQLVSPLPKAVQADTKGVNVSPVPTRIPATDPRITKLQTYLTEKKSPLAGHSALIIQEADAHDIPWTLITSIAGKESGFGKNIKQGSHNAWGIGGASNFYYFDTWEEGIKYTSKLLGNHYRENMNSAIQEKYCPKIECSDTWTQDVTYFQKEVNK